MYKWDIEELKFQIGKLIQLHRLKKNLSQFQLGNELNLSSNHVGRIERAETNPTIENLVKFCNFFEIDMLFLFKKLTDKELKNIESEIEYLQKIFKNKNKTKS
ncbi:helix-turn-helix domain-containing protein [Chryseobacterium sp. W4I1]|uniref:helix-turn-helix domain-containing protein n=1 Tax=Chryseobacterium sp. W4I1 TaxID=3042293 RepID=UPI00278483AE|nr:helix-turn-helix transcriptional regulator [Chryseobacterium sp. W4I1]MDQ0783202.1 transcriptional regulator with XRE-family HTH domain [Chryseobacterium sp. W4I1]